MLQFILERLHLHDLSPKVWRWTGIVVALLTLIQGTLSISAVYHCQLARVDSTALAMLIAVTVYPLFGVLFGLTALLFLAFGRMLIEIATGIASAWNALKRLPANVAAMDAKDWGLVAYMAVAFSVYGGIGFFMWPTAASVAAWLPAWVLGSVSFMSILLVDAFISMFIWAIALVILMALFALAVSFFKRPPNR
jgi:hypothetical protein